MKLIYSFFMFFFLTVAASAMPSIRPVGPDPNQLAKDPRFRMFAYNLLEHIKQWSSLYKFEKPEFQTEFIEALRSSEAEAEEEVIAEIYAKYGIEFEEAMSMQNAVDNDFFTLMLDFPEFEDVDDESTLKIVVEALGIVSKEEPTQMEVEKVLPPGDPKGPGLTIEEVWDCTLEGLGVGAGSLISIHAIKKLAAEKGVQAVVISLSKTLAKRAGWIGAITVLIDFSLCLKTQIED